MLKPWEEIIQAQAVRSDLLKWKILAIAALGAVGLGLTDTNNPTHADLVLCCVPFVCAYIDALCRHLSLRIRVISRLWENGVREPGAGDMIYLAVHEKHVQAARQRGVYLLENYLVVLSSVVFSLLLILLPAILDENVLPHGNVITASGVVGVILAIGIELSFRVLRERVDALPTPDLDFNKVIAHNTVNRADG
jgi:hypothetical protein